MSATPFAGRFPRGRAATWLGAAFGASVVLNLVLGGTLAWQAWRGPPPRGFDGMMARLEHRLPEADRPAFQAAIARQRATLAPKLEALREARPKVDAAVAREPFDPAALRGAAEDWARLWHDFTVSFGEATAEALAGVSPEGRARFAAGRPPR